MTRLTPECDGLHTHLGRRFAIMSARGVRGFPTLDARIRPENLWLLPAEPQEPRTDQAFTRAPWLESKLHFHFVNQRSSAIEKERAWHHEIPSTRSSKRFHR